MAQTSIHFQAVKGGSEEHNKRTKKLDYVHHELSSKNDYWQSDTQEARLAFVTQNAKAKTGRKMQAKATPLREAVVVIEDTTTMDDLKELAKRFNDRFGIDVFQIAIHRDEGYKKSKDGLKLNLHAHMVADWTDHTSGKSLKLNRNDMAEMQTITAEVLGMERGKSSEKQHLSAIQFKIAAEEQRAEAQTKAIALQSVLSGLAIHAAKQEQEAIESKTRGLGIIQKNISNDISDLLVEVKNKSKECDRLALSAKNFERILEYNTKEAKKKALINERLSNEGKSLREEKERLRNEISGLSEQKDEVLKLVEQKEQLKKDVLSLDCRQQETQMELDVLNGEVFMKEKSRDILQGEVQELTEKRDKAKQETAAARASLQELTRNKEHVKTWKWAYNELLHIIQPVLDAITRLAHVNGRGAKFTAFETFQINFALGKDDKREERAARYTRWAKEDEEKPFLYGDYRYRVAGEEMQKIAKNPTAYLNSIKENQSRGIGY